MAQQALLSGTTQTRRRALFGLLDANGWAWASVKAVFWFILIIFLLGYLPDRAYYFTVNRTMDLGILAWSPINFCPPENRTLPCPAPVGAAVPWDSGPQEISLPEPRIDGGIVQVGTRLLYIGGSDGSGPTATTYVATTSGVGNFDKWIPGPDLPEPRSNATVGFAVGKIYVIGGIGADNKPTDTVFILSPNSQTGELGNWQTAEELKLDVALPEARSGAAFVAGADGVLLVGGTADGTTPVKTVWKSTFDTKGDLTAWTPQAELFQETTDAVAVLTGDYLWVYGGSAASGPTATVQRGEFAVENPDTRESEAANLAKFGVAGGPTDLPGPRTNAAGFTASGAIYLIGGRDATGIRSELYWAVPDANGNIPEWKHLAESDLPESAGGLAGSSPIVLGPNVVLVGGETASGPIAGAARANIAPQPPFFQLGLVGATVPALKIDGEIGQQLGYLNANGLGIANFAILLLVGWAFAHKEQVRAMRDRLRRRRAR
jgi:N-acetylneuraminic acid mutarotase